MYGVLFPAYSRKSDLSTLTIVPNSYLAVLYNNRDLTVSPGKFEHLRQTVRLHDHVYIFKRYLLPFKCPTGSIGKWSCAFAENDN